MRRWIAPRVPHYVVLVKDAQTIHAGKRKTFPGWVVAAPLVLAAFRRRNLNQVSLWNKNVMSDKE